LTRGETQNTTEEKEKNQPHIQPHLHRVLRRPQVPLKLKTARRLSIYIVKILSLPYLNMAIAYKDAPSIRAAVRHRIQRPHSRSTRVSLGKNETCFKYAEIGTTQIKVTLNGIRTYRKS